MAWTNALVVLLVLWAFSEIARRVLPDKGRAQVARVLRPVPVLGPYWARQWAPDSPKSNCGGCGGACGSGQNRKKA